MTAPHQVSEWLREWIARLPKVELHVHLEGTLEAGMKLDIARRNGIDVGQTSEAEVLAAYDFHDLPSFIAAYNASQVVLQTVADFEGLAYAYLVRCRDQRVRHVELFFDPQLHTGRGVPFEDVISGYRRAVVRASTELGVSAELILCFLRDLTPDAAMATLMEALPYRDWIIGVGLDSVEEGNPPSRFREVYDRARREGFRLTFHRDLDQVDQLEHLRQGVEDLGCGRVDHGLHVLDDASLLRRVRDGRIGFTATPLGYATFTPTMKMPEIRALLDAGVAVSIGSDDPAFFCGHLIDALEACVRVGGMSPSDLVALQRNAIETAWIPTGRRDELLDELETFAAAAHDAR